MRIDTIILQTEGVNNIISMYLTLLYPFIIIIIITVILSLIIDRVSRDRVIKLFDDDWVVMLYTDVDKNGLNEAYFGRIYVPPRASGGFELLYSVKSIEGPEKLIAYLMRMYRRTGEKKYKERAEELFDILKDAGKLQYESVDEIKYDPFMNPSQASKKVYKENIKEIYAIIRFLDDMSDDRKEKRIKDIEATFHPGFFRRTKRSITNMLSLAKDKLKEATGMVASSVSKVAPVDVSKTVKQYGEKAVGQVGSSYNALLENSVGRLVKIKVSDVDGVDRYYDGVLREYSANYIAVYDVDYQIAEEAVFIGEKMLENYPTERLDFHGWQLGERQHLEILDMVVEKNMLRFKIKNIYDNHVYIDKIIINDNLEIALEDPNMTPNEVEEVSVKGNFSEPPNIRVLYRIIKTADIIWPLSKARVIGSGEPASSFVKQLIHKIRGQ
jgi:hypothetical protein